MAFHAQNFGSTAAPTQTQLKGPSFLDEGVQSSTPEEDDLGYYPDGNKRTLTDDQIAMFRHSEVYSILRERQVRKENQEADGEDQSDDLGLKATVSLEAGEEMEDTKGHDNEDRKDSAEKQNDAEVPATKNKRKRHNADKGDRRGRQYTSRRLARELDSILAEDQVLDYGDEPSTAHSPTHGHPVVASVSTAVDQVPDASITGRKIWWPVMQAN